MSKSLDPVTWLAAAVLVAGGGLGLWWAASDDSDSAPNTKSAPDNPTPSGGGGAGGSGGDTASAPPATSTGWVPASASDAVSRDQAGQTLPDGDSCIDRPNPIDLAKDVAAQFEGELRKATAISDSEEGTLGDRLEREAPKAEPFRGKWDLDADRATYGSYLQDLVDHLAKSNHRPGLRYRVHVVRDAAFNAFALPGGVLAVHTAVLEGPAAVHSEAELAVVLGHEIAHVERHHPVAAYQYARMIAGESADDAVVIVQMLKMPLSSEYEHEADARGLELAAAGQYDPFAACQLWSRQVNRGGAPKPSLGGLIGEVVGAAEQVLHSHPPAAQRCARTRDKGKQLNDSASVAKWYRGERNVRERVVGPKHPY